MSDYKILLIEDTDLDYELVKRYVEKKATFSTTFQRVETRDEFEKVVAGNWDVIISDYNVPGFGAIDALQYIKKHELDIPFVIVSGEVGEENAVDALLLGADDFIMKSNLARLIPSIERSIRNSRNRQRKSRLKAAHEQAVKDREKLLDVVCHDLKNPLSSIRLSCQLLISKGKDPEQLEHTWVVELAEAMLRSSERIDRLVRDLLDQSRMEAGLFTIRSSEIDVSAFISEIMDVFLPIAEIKNIALILDMPRKQIKKFFDKDRIFQVVGNLLNNAIKFSPNGSEVILAVKETEAGGIEFQVRDSGPGIKDDEKSNIFSKFFQGKSDKYKGNGLGLWIAHEIVHAHSGNIGFTSREDSTGSIFWFKLPSPLSTANPVSPSCAGTSKILLVDDDEDLSETLVKILKDRKINYRSAENVSAAIQILSNESWSEQDILLIDYDLPIQNGGELVSWIREHFDESSAPKIILMSAHPDIDERAKKLNIHSFLRKPMNLTDVFALISRPESISPLQSH